MPGGCLGADEGPDVDGTGLAPSCRGPAVKPTPSPDTVDEYIRAFAPETRAILEAVRATVLAAVPEGEERISYRMPAVFCHGVVVYYAAFRNHLGLYPPVEDARVRQRVAAWAGPKGNLQFQYSQPIPYGLIAEVATARLKANLARAR